MQVLTSTITSSRGLVSTTKSANRLGWAAVTWAK